MHGQGVLLGKFPPTNVTGKRLLAGVGADVAGQVAGGTEVTHADSTLEGLLAARVYLGMAHAVGRVGKFPPTNVTGKRLLAGVGADVAGQVVGATEVTHADSTLEGPLSHSGGYPMNADLPLLLGGHLVIVILVIDVMIFIITVMVFVVHGPRAGILLHVTAG